MFASFDNLELPVVSIEDISTNYGANFASHALIGRKPKLQYVAMNSRSVSMKLRYHYYYGDVKSARKKLLDKARDHQAGVLTFGSGVNFGTFVIESINETFSQTDDTGRLMVAEYDVTFKESGNERVQTKAPAIKKDTQKATPANNAQQRNNQAKVTGNKPTQTKAQTAKQTVRQ